MNKFSVLIFITFLYANIINNVSATMGLVELDKFTFDKVLSKFDASLVKFDVAFPYGEKHDTFAEVALTSQPTDNLLVAEVGVKDYGERDNEELAKKYKITKEDYPAVFLFTKGKREPTRYTGDFTAKSLRDFVKDHSKIRLTLPGCVSSLDAISLKFALANNDLRKVLVKEAEEIIVELDNEKKKIGKIYKSIMEQVIEKGFDFIKKEIARVNKVLKGQLSKNKVEELNAKINVLSSFSDGDIKKNEEL